MKLDSRTATAAMAALALGATAQAELIGFDLVDTPDIFSSFIDVLYDADTNVFDADGFALSLDDGSGDPITITDGLFMLDAIVNDFGVAESGSLVIEGDLDGDGSTLLMGDLSDFGFVDPPDGGQIFEFLFQVTGGFLVDAFGGIGAQFGVILDMNGGGYNGMWNESFDNLIGGIPGTGAGNADTAPLTPAPSALVVMAGLLGMRRRRRTA